jgi:hypothetical protein
MAKNPTFPFYAQDYLVDTLRWKREMKSLHIDLMCESWVNGALTDHDGAPVGLHAEDLEIWEKIKHKWVLLDGFWVNGKLEECREKKKKFLEHQSENGKKGGRPKIIKANENPNETQAFLKTKPKKKPLENENENEYSKGKEGTGEKPLAEPIVPEMVTKFKKTFPKYPTEEIKDFHACFQIACKIGEEKKFSPVTILDAGREYVLKRWGEIILFVKEDKWFSKRSLHQINNEWQSLIQTIHSNGTKTKQNSKHQSTIQPGTVDLTENWG